MTEIKESSDLADADSQAKWGLRSVASGLEVSGADVARLESEFIVDRSSRPQRLVRPRQNRLVAACAVLALALALAALSIAASAIGETAEAERCATFLGDSSPEAAEELLGS